MGVFDGIFTAPQFGWHGVGNAQSAMHSAAIANFSRIHGCKPDPAMNLFPFLREYGPTPTLEQLSSRLSDLSNRIDDATQRLIRAST